MITIQPATPFLVSQIKKKKNLPKTTTAKLEKTKEWEINMRQQCITKHLSNYIYSTATL